MTQTIMEQVLAHYEQVDFDRITANDVQRALAKEVLQAEDFAALLSPAAEPFLEQMAQRAKATTQRQFGNSIALYTPLYLANYCVNHCSYCGFHCKNDIQRAKLTEDEIEHEMKVIAQTGLREILLLTGESRYHSDVEYIGQGVKLAKKYFTTVGIEVYPMEAQEYAYLQQCGADFVSIYQETYDQQRYDEVHISGPKKVYHYRFEGPERALQGGMRGVGIGALLGLGDFRKDAFATGMHGWYLLQKYPHGELSLSVPRLRPYVNEGQPKANDVGERQLLQVMLAYRIFLPYASMSISTRERAWFRDHVVGLCATRISAGVKTGVGGHDEESKGDEQFAISDERSVAQIEQMLHQRNMQPVYSDYISM